ncbi:hypothetical protein DL771_007494 [Monosporascus sp. 5C6A]|nr:hypothetical protein DL771_007494 [Monosporascus sp. 5C6A]
MLCLLTCPPAYLALRREIDTAFASDPLSHPAVTDTEACALPHIDVALREAMRPHPSVVSPSNLSPVNPRRRQTEPIRCVDSWYLAGRKSVPTYQRAEVRGDFWTRRCLLPTGALAQRGRGTEGNRLNRMRKTFDLVSGAGKFMCMGKAIAWMEARKLFVDLMRRFDFAIVGSIKPFRVEYLAIMMVHDFNERVTRRTTTSLHEREGTCPWGTQWAMGKLKISLFYGPT